MASTVLVRPSGTSWGSVIGGWIAAVGMATLVAPLVAGLLAGRTVAPNDLGLAVPVIVGLMMAFLVGGYIAGRMAGYNTSWHGMMSAFFGLFVVLIALLVAAAAEAGWLSAQGVRSIADLFPGVRDLQIQTLGDTLTFGAILGFLATIFAGWLGGLLAPDRYVTPVTAPASAIEHRVEERVQVRERPRFRLLPQIGRKGGERVEKEREVRESRVERP